MVNPSESAAADTTEQSLTSVVPGIDSTEILTQELGESPTTLQLETIIHPTPDTIKDFAGEDYRDPDYVAQLTTAAQQSAESHQFTIDGALALLDQDETKEVEIAEAAQTSEVTPPSYKEVEAAFDSLLRELAIAKSHYYESARDTFVTLIAEPIKMSRQAAMTQVIDHFSSKLTLQHVEAA